MIQKVYYPTRIPKDGVYRHCWCETCKQDKLHLIRFHRNNIHNQTIEYDQFCEECFGKWNSSQEVSKMFGGEVETIFYGEMKTVSYQIWNELIKWG